MPWVSAVLPAPSGPVEQHQVAGAQQPGQPAAEVPGVLDGRQLDDVTHRSSTLCNDSRNRASAALTSSACSSITTCPLSVIFTNSACGSRRTISSEWVTGVIMSLSPTTTSTGVAASAASAGKREWVARVRR